MKKKTLWITIFSILFIALISFTIYAAFSMTQSYDAEINHHQIKNQTLISEDEIYSVTFAKPGDYYELSYTLTNSDTRNYVYYYSLSLVDVDSNILNEEYDSLSMIYVYEGEKYIGVLSDFVYTPADLTKQNLTSIKYIFAGEALTSSFKLELHNGAGAYVLDYSSIKLKLTAHIYTTNAQTVLYSDNTDSFDKIISDLNSDLLTRGEIPTIVLTSDISTSLAYTIQKDCIIDLCGNTLTLGGDITIAEGVSVIIKDSRTGGNSTGSNFVLGYDTSYLDLQTKISNVLVTNFDCTQLFASIEVYAQSINRIVCGSNFDLIGNYSPYLNGTGLTITSNDATITNGIVSDDTVTLNTNEVLTVLYSYNDNELEIGYSYIGNDSTLFAEIINSDLAHLTQFITEDNGIQLTNNIYLPTALKEHNATISWFSSNEEIMSNDGISQVNQGNVVLTATIKVYDKVFVQNYYIYVVQQDNLTKLQYLATRVEKGVTLPMDPNNVNDDLDVNVILTEVNDKKPLPVAGANLVDDYYYYTNWTDGVDLGIEELSYEIESTYYYISTDLTTQDYAEGHLITGKLLDSASVYLNQITYSKAARIKIRGYFDNGDIEETFITVTISLSSSTLADEVFEDVQNYLNSVDVLQNILDTREINGVINEKGDFEIPANIDVVNLTYSSLEPNLYDFLKDENDNLLKNENGKYVVVFKDLRHLALTDKTVNISCSIVVETVDENGDVLITTPETETLSFVVPGAVTTNNFTSFDFENAENTKNIFYSFKYQTLQQSTENPYYVKNIEGVEDKKLTGAVTVEEIFKLPEYILMYDIQNTNQLMFEYGSEVVVIDYYDIDIFGKILTWATTTESSESRVENQDFSQYLDKGLGWIPNDGNITLSDEEIIVIKAYAERFPGFMEIWNQKINVLDNIITESDYNALLATLASDKLYISILNWMKDSNGIYSLHDWLYYMDSSSPYFDQFGKDNDLEQFINKSIETEWSALSDAEKTARLKTYYFNSLSDSEKDDVVNSIYNSINETQRNTYLELYLQENGLTADGLTDEQKEAYIKTYIKDNLTEDQAYSTLTNADIINLTEEYKDSLYLGLTDQQKQDYYNDLVASHYTVASNYNEEANRLKVPQEFLHLQSNGIEDISNDEERVIVYYVMDKYNTKYETFYDNWKNAISRKNDTEGSVKKVLTNDITGYSYDYSEYIINYKNLKYSLNSCYDPLFKHIIEWVTYTTSSESISAGYDLSSKSSLFAPLLGDFSTLKNQWSYGLVDGYFNDYPWYCEMISQNEWNVLCLYLNYYGITQITVGDVTVDMQNSTYSSFPIDGVATSNGNEGNWLTEDFINAMISAVNAKYLDTLITDYNKLVDWAKNTTSTSIVSWNSIVSGYSLTDCDSNRIKDGFTNISNDEHTVLSTFFSEQVANGFDSKLKEVLLSYHIGTDMELEDSIIDDSDYKNILNDVVGIGDFDEFYEYATKLQSNKPTDDSNYDNLETISKKELIYIATKYKDSDKFIAKLNELVGAYNISIVDGSVVVNPVETNLDRTLTAEDKEALNSFINISLDNTDKSNVYKYLSLSKISSTDVETFQLLRYYSNLTRMLFRGTSTSYLFASNDDANRVFDIIATSVTSIEEITMTYCGVNNIELIEKLINLTYLDLRGNYSKNETFIINDVDTKVTYVGLSNISPLIALEDNKNIYNDSLEDGETACEYIKYLNVFNTDVTFKHAEVVLDILYYARGFTNDNRPSLWYEYNDLETLYDPTAVADRAAYDLVALLYDISEMSGNYIILPTLVFDENHTTGVNISWKVEEAKGLVKLNSIENKIERLNSTSKGQVVVSASVTVNGITAIRYFVITLI